MPDEEDFQDDGSEYTTRSIVEAALGDMYSHPNMPPIDDRSMESTNLQDYFGAIPGIHSPENIPAIPQSIIQPNNAQQTIPSPTAEDDPTIPKSRSLAHHEFEANKVVFVSFDIETGGEYCGILQMSAEAEIMRLKVTPKLMQAGKNKGKPSNSEDCPENVVRESNTFNKYVKPHEGVIKKCGREYSAT